MLDSSCKLNIAASIGNGMTGTASVAVVTRHRQAHASTQRGKQVRLQHQVAVRRLSRMHGRQMNVEHDDRCGRVTIQLREPQREQTMNDIVAATDSANSRCRHFAVVDTVKSQSSTALSTAAAAAATAAHQPRRRSREQRDEDADWNHCPCSIDISRTAGLVSLNLRRRASSSLMLTRQSHMGSNCKNDYGDGIRIVAKGHHSARNPGLRIEFASSSSSSSHSSTSIANNITSGVALSSKLSSCIIHSAFCTRPAEQERDMQVADASSSDQLREAPMEAAATSSIGGAPQPEVAMQSDGSSCLAQNNSDNSSSSKISGKLVVNPAEEAEEERQRKRAQERDDPELRDTLLLVLCIELASQHRCDDSGHERAKG